ncbi:MAG: AAA family ATPase [Proteobacteria bacterium]|nr:AAA family ATPase [Pseudomonadota bacterium]MBU0965497.1 AAA family ATPase [Pseudomonadota bacterium]
MYRAFYNLKEKPFQITTDSRFLWLGEKHKEAFATLKYGILDDKGFLLLIGDVGTGKTTLINALINTLNSKVILAKIPDPKLDEMDFYRLLANEFSIKKPFNTKGEFLLLFTEFLEKAYVSGKQVVLIADEAQRLSPELLEDIRHLSNIEKEHVKLLNIFFVGQVEFNNILLEKRNRAIRQRITIHYTLGALNEQEIGQYIHHRLQVAGTAEEIFNADAVLEVFKFSGGAPRLINIICDRALLTGFVESKKKIDAAMIIECAAELQISPYDDDDKPKKEEPAVDEGTAERGATGKDKVTSTPAVPPAAVRSELEHIQLDLTGVRKKKSGMWGIFFIYFTLILLIGALCAYFFYLPY